MKAIVQDTYGSADVLRLMEIPVPAVGEQDVLVRVHAAGVNPGDWHMMTGQPYLMRAMGFGLRRPKSRTRGIDVAGRVEAVGAQVTRLAVGDEVFGTADGSFAEHAVGSERTLVPAPSSLTSVQAAAVPTAGCAALVAVRSTAHVRAGQSVLVIGAGGGVGSFAVQIALASGAEVTGLCSSSKVGLVRTLGAQHVVDYTALDAAGAPLPAPPGGYDVIIDTGGARPLAALRRILAPRGTLVMVGAEGGDRWLGGVQHMLLALAISPFVSQRLRPMMSTERPEHLLALSELAEAGSLVPAIDRTYPLAEAADAVRHLATGHPAGKVVVTV